LQLQLEIQCGSALFVVTDCPHGTAARVRVAQHEVADPLGMAGGVRHGDRPALRHP
jgi:hypothetical protein